MCIVYLGDSLDKLSNVLGMTLNSSVVVLSMTLNSSGTSKERYSVSKLQFALPQVIFFVWSYPTCCVASLRAVPVGCISYKSVYCITFRHLYKGTNQIYDDDDDDDDDKMIIFFR